jgi:hypothetical protein
MSDVIQTLLVDGQPINEDLVFIKTRELANLLRVKTITAGRILTNLPEWEKWSISRYVYVGPRPKGWRPAKVTKNDLF